MLLKIVQVGAPVLRKTGRKLSKKEIVSPRTQQLIELMRETMREAPGVGLAAPQVGESIQLAVIEDAPARVDELPAAKRKALERNGVPFHVVINPVVTVTDAFGVTAFEGCLSVPNFSALVTRARGVRVEALDHRGRPVKIDASGWYARILQHEIDHLFGNLYTDRMIPRSLTTNENHGRHLAGLRLEEVAQLLGLAKE